MPEPIAPASPSPAQRRLDHDLLASLVLSPFAALSSTIVGYSVAHWVCDVNRKTDGFIVSLVNFAVCLLAAALAYVVHKRLGAGDETVPEIGRRRFMAYIALSLSGFAAVVVIAQTLAMVTLNPCD